MSTCHVPPDTYRKAQAYLSALNARQCVELLLLNDQTASAPGTVNASELLSKGLALLEKDPHAALEVPIGSKTQEIRKAYKKAALKYHPDKNPKTTPLFQAIQSACDKLSDRTERAKAEQKASSTPRPPPPTQQASAPQPARHSQPTPSYASSNQAPKYQQQAKSSYQPAAKAAAAAAAAAAAPAGSNRFAEAYSRYAYQSESQQNQQAPPPQHDINEEARRRWAARQAAEKRADDMRAAAAKEAAAQKERDDIMKAGQKAYMDEQAKLRRAAYEREKMAAEAAEARRRAMYGAAPTPTPDSAQYVPPGNRDPGGGKNAYKPYAAGAPPPAAAPGAQAYTASSDGKVKPANVPGAASAASAADYNAYNYKKKYEVPVPIAFKCVTTTESSVELEWRISLYCTKSVLIELNWRRRAPAATWQSAPKLINGLKCKKNNLDLSSGANGSTYEFRIRAIEDLPGGMLGERSAWTDILVVEPVKSKAQQPSQQSQQPQPQPQPQGSKSEPTTARPTSGNGAKPAASKGPPASTNLPSFSNQQSTSPSTTSASSAASAASTNNSNQPSTGYHYVFTKPEKEVVRPKATENPSAATATSSTSSASSSSSNGNLHVPPINGGSGSKDKPSAGFQYPAYIFNEKVKLAEPAKPAVSKGSGATAAAEAAPSSSSSSSSSSSAAAAATAAAPSSSSAAGAGTASNGTTAAGEERQTYTKPVRPTIDTRHVRRHSSFVKTGQYGTVKDDFKRSKVMEDLDKEVEGVVVDDDDDPDGEDEEEFEKKLAKSVGKQPVSPNCTMQTNFSMTRKAWEDIMQSPQPAKSSPKAAGTKKEGNKENTTSGKPAARPRSAEVAEELSSSGKSQKVASPRRHSTGTAPARKGSASDDTKYDADRFEADEVEEDEELVRSLGSKGRPGYFDAAAHEDEHSIEEEDSQGGHDAAAAAHEHPRHPTSTTKAASLRPKKQPVKKASPPKVNTATKAKAQPQTQTQTQKSSSELWFKLAPQKAPAGARPSDRYEHPVREEPLPGAEEVGYLVPGLAVMAQAVVGEWAKVRFHKKRAVAGKAGTGTLRSDGWGWCLMKDPATGAPHLLPTGDGGEEEVEEDDEVKEVDISRASHASTAGKGLMATDDDDDDEPVTWSPSHGADDAAATTGSVGVEEWYERWDSEGGYMYYWSAATGEASWEAPEWVEEIDPRTGASYFIQLSPADGSPITSTWEQPPHYVRLYRLSEFDKD